jgi:hypothetical protein
MWPEAIASWIIAAAFIGFVARRIGRSQITWTVLPLLVSPMVGLVALLVAGDARPDSEPNNSSVSPNQRRCTASDDAIFPSDRATCPHCGATIDAGDSVHPRVN